ncbi:MAG: hypothetical protein FIB06_03605 [Betaproteobacteria bacterium]|nr:hypothetical protein [Betaproteobacteria bacterium]
MSEDVFNKDDFDLARLAPQIRLDFNPNGIKEQLGLEQEHVRLIVSLEDKALKKTLVVRNMTIDECVANEIIDIPPAISRRLSWVGVTKVLISLVLANDRAADLGEATRAGNWLARKEISIAKPRDAATFPIEIVPGEWFKSRGLPTETTYFVEILSDDLNQPCEQLPEMVRVYVNEAVNQVLARAEDSPAGRALVRSIYCDTAATILSHGFGNLEDGGELLEEGILAVVVKRLAEATDLESSAIARMAREAGSGAGKLRALLQTESGLTKALASISLRG